MAARRTLKFLQRGVGGDAIAAGERVAVLDVFTQDKSSLILRQFSNHDRFGRIFEPFYRVNPSLTRENSTA
jgi:hypothetical protein